VPPPEALPEEDLADPAAAHADAPLGQVGDQAVEGPGRERQAEISGTGQRRVDDGAPLLGGVRRRPSGAHVLFQSLQPAGVEALEPVPRRGAAQVHPGADLGSFETLQRMQDDPRSSHEARTPRARARHPFEPLPLLIAQGSHAKGHGWAPPQVAMATR
jgi:hypothetical protein